jgi:hypothetical protein
MNSPNELLNLTVTLIESDIEQRDYAIRQLQREIADLDVGTIEAFSKDNQTSTGEKSFDPATLNALLLSIAPITVTKILEYLHNWITRKEGRSIRIKIQKSKGSAVEIEIPSSMSTKELKKLIKTVETSMSDSYRKRK